MMREAEYIGDLLLKAGLDECELCGGVVLPCNGKLPPRDQDGCVRCRACHERRSEKRVDPAQWLIKEGGEKPPKRPPDVPHCSDCGAVLPSDRKWGRCERCKDKQNRQTARDRKRKQRRKW